MKRKLISVVLCLVLSLSLCAPALAVTDDGQKAAEALRALGLLQGTSDTEFNPVLDENLTRAEAVTLICRFFGAENEALDKTWNTPFMDVPDWAAPYVGWAYTNGITDGTGNTTFGPDAAIPSCQFITLMLRSMGYSEGADAFSWADPFALAAGVGLIDEGADTKGALCRDSVMIICLNALSAPLKDGNETVADKLIALGVFTQEQYAAAKIQYGTGEEKNSGGSTAGNTGGSVPVRHYRFEASISGPATEGNDVLKTGETLTNLVSESSIRSCFLVSFSYNELRSTFGTETAQAVIGIYNDSSGAWGTSVTGDEELWQALTKSSTIGSLGEGSYQLYFTEPATQNQYSLTVAITAE